ncbi:hypothetical protein [Saccharopolyspora gregorii]|uniref:hypothetical protein n=1 Tax=Saccharopolyspora gregorii TaxID=33914 RepID=UPI0021AD4039|nr:hypothetical protein [Saccharopolyspora gregorii]
MPEIRPEVHLSLEAPDATPERLHRAARLLQGELRRVRGLAVRRLREEPPPDGRGTGALLAELVLGGTLATGSITTLSTVLTGWVDRGEHRAITLRCEGVLRRIEAGTPPVEAEAVLHRLRAEDRG